MKNFQIQNGTLKVSAIWHDPKGDRKRGIYTIAITKSSKGTDGAWKDQTVYLFPEESFAISKMLEKVQDTIIQPNEFEIKKDSTSTADAIDKLIESVNVGDDIPS